MAACYETRHARGDALPTHRHREAYAALVLDGSYEENSVDGPLPSRPGVLLLHPPYHAHGNRFERSGARVINLVLPALDGVAQAQARLVPDLREAIAIFRHAPQRFAQLRAASTPCEPPQVPAWQRAFVEALGAGDRPIADLAREFGVSAAHASRALSLSHGMSPQALRRELRWRRALALLATPAPLADVAADAGFADQSHLTRVVRAHAGLPPSALRRRIGGIKCVQYAAAAAALQ
ncbi:AraC family transcriptional regulator [Dokdonella ginsengisoli]|uniref:Helix-turn-helix domain-containing protein n=1 Tax=Dokdonella ginsengisoli TaxID=363846 RepID=A0ABV9QUW9_9GAMM